MKELLLLSLVLTGANDTTVPVEEENQTTETEEIVKFLTQDLPAMTIGGVSVGFLITWTIDALIKYKKSKKEKEQNETLKNFLTKFDEKLDKLESRINELEKIHTHYEEINDKYIQDYKNQAKKITDELKNSTQTLSNYSLMVKRTEAIVNSINAMSKYSEFTKEGINTEVNRIIEEVK